MQAEVTAAIITGAIAILSPITTYWIIRSIDRKSLKTIEGRLKAVIGTWNGTIRQTSNEQILTIPIEISFTAGIKLIEGMAHFVSPIDNRLVKLKFTGGFLHDRFIKLDYKNEDGISIQFGTAITDLSADGQHLTGMFVGYGSQLNQIVRGEVSLARKP